MARDAPQAMNRAGRDWVGAEFSRKNASERARIAAFSFSSMRVRDLCGDIFSPRQKRMHQNRAPAPKSGAGGTQVANTIIARQQSLGRGARWSTQVQCQMDAAPARGYH